MSNTETVKAIYEAFGRGDVTTILDRLDDAVEWETTVPVSDVPWLQARRGKANIVVFKNAAALRYGSDSFGEASGRDGYRHSC